MDNRYFFTEIKDDSVVITGGEAQHLSRVRRAKIGDDIVAFNGDGYDYHLKINEITKDKVSARIIDKILNRATDDTNITVYLSMIKNDALSTAIDNLAELNVKHVKLFKSDYSVAIIDEKKLDKLNQIAIQASKQSERADVMKISIINKKDIQNDCKNLNTFFAYEDSNNKIEKFNGDFTVVIGPEGGFSNSENEYFSSFAKNISLSKTILRAEVACVAGVSMLKAVCGEG